MPMINVSEATGLVLNYLVARCERHESRCAWMAAEGWDKWQSYERAWGNPIPDYSTNPQVSQPIIEREGISVIKRPRHEPHCWSADNFSDPTRPQYLEFGPTMLVAAMRCYVVSKLGLTVAVPDGLQ